MIIGIALPAQASPYTEGVAKLHCAYLLQGNNWQKSMESALYAAISNGAKESDLPPGDIMAEIMKFCPELNTKAWQQWKANSI